MHQKTFLHATEVLLALKAPSELMTPQTLSPLQVLLVMTLVHLYQKEIEMHKIAAFAFVVG